MKEAAVKRTITLPAAQARFVDEQMALGLKRSAVISIALSRLMADPTFSLTEALDNSKQNANNNAEKVA